MKKIVKKGKYKNFKYYVILNHNPECRTFFSGFIKIPKNHPLYWRIVIDPDYFEVHGGVTMSSVGLPADKSKKGWYIGFSCGQPGDDYHIQDKRFTEAECKSLINQLILHKDAIEREIRSGKSI